MFSLEDRLYIPVASREGPFRQLSGCRIKAEGFPTQLPIQVRVLPLLDILGDVTPQSGLNAKQLTDAGRAWRLAGFERTTSPVKYEARMRVLATARAGLAPPLPGPGALHGDCGDLRAVSTAASSTERTSTHCQRASCTGSGSSQPRRKSKLRTPPPDI